jgi:hypothetical protein
MALSRTPLSDGLRVIILVSGAFGHSYGEASWAIRRGSSSSRVLKIG